MDDPFEIFHQWFQMARELQTKGVRYWDQVHLATCDSHGWPSARIVLLKAYDQRGFVFYTNYGSRKSQELLVNPKAALCFYWEQL